MPKALKIILVILGIVVIVSIGLVLLNVIPLSAPEISEAVVCKKVDPERAEAIDILGEFESDTPAIYCVIKTVGVRGKSVIKAEWHYEGHKLTENSLVVPGETFLHYNRQLYFELKKPEKADWNAGHYEVKIYLDDQLKQSVSFKIKEEEGQAREAKIAEATLCKKVDENFAPQDKTDSFPPDTDKIYCSVMIKNAQKGAVIKAQWCNKDKNQLLDSSSYTVLKDHSAGYVAFSYSADGQKWDKGEYEVKIYVGNKLIKVASFKIE
jgi:hypothetical protein